MSANEVITVATTRDGNTEQQKPIVDESAIYRPKRFLRGLTVFNWMMKKGAGTRIGDQKIKVFNELPFAQDVIVTATASVGAVSVSVQNSSFIRRNSRLAHRGVQDVKCTVDPTSLTAFTCSALDAELPANTVLKLHGQTIGEGFTRQTPISRATNYHFDYTSTKAKAFAFTNFLKARDYYIEKESMRIKKQHWEEFEFDCASELMLSKGRDGTSTGDFSTNGLVWQGYNSNYFFLPGGVLTADMIDEGAYLLMTNGNAAGELDLIMGQRLASTASRAAINAGIVRQNSPQDPTLGVKLINRAASAIDHLTGYRISVDHTLNSKGGWDRMVILVNWDAIRPISNLPSMTMERIGDPGSDLQDGMAQSIRSLGWEYKISNGAVVIFDNVQSIAY